jgi:hypothetical protein
MKILMTGMTAKMIGSQRLKRDYVICADLFIKILSFIPGVKVEIRKIEVNEDLSGYDQILVGITPLGSLGSVYADRALMALARYPKKCVLFTDDWSVCFILQNSASKLRTWDKYMGFRKYDKRYSKDMKHSINAILDGQFSILNFMFTWGHHRVFNHPVMDERIIPIDPSILIEGSHYVDGAPKARRWVSATLGDQSDWLRRQGFRWEIIQVGQKRFNQPILGEDEVCQLYAQNWGVVSARYPNVGSGWWRVRYNFSEQNNAIIYCDYEDGKMIGPEFCRSPGEIESLDDAGLQRLAELQRLSLKNRYESKITMIKKMKGAIGC